MTGGIAPYSVLSSDSKIVTASIGSVIGTYLYITGVSVGSANITVKDAVGTTTKIDVTVK